MWRSFHNLLGGDNTSWCPDKSPFAMITLQVLEDLAEVRSLLARLELFMPTGREWAASEQQLFWEALARYPAGPWIHIARHIGSKSARQVMTHAQKLRQKLRRWQHRRHRRDTASSAMLWHGQCGLQQVVSSPADVDYCPNTHVVRQLEPDDWRNATLEHMEPLTQEIEAEHAWCLPAPGFVDAAVLADMRTELLFRAPDDQ